MAAEARRGAGDGEEPGFPVERSRMAPRCVRKTTTQGRRQRKTLACGFRPGCPSASPCRGRRSDESRPPAMSLTRTPSRTIGPRTFTPSASTARGQTSGGDPRWPRWERPSDGNPPPSGMPIIANGASREYTTTADLNPARFKDARDLKQRRVRWPQWHGARPSFGTRPSMGGLLPAWECAVAPRVAEPGLHVTRPGRMKEWRHAKVGDPWA